MAWTRIERSGKPRVRGPNDQYPGLIDVEIDLTLTPPREWAQAFLNPSGVSISMGWRHPTLSDATIRIMPPDDKLEANVAEVDARIAAANDYFERQVLPSLQAAEASAQRDQAAAQARIADAQRRADKL